MRDLIDLVTECLGFEWDSGNIDKNWLSHQVSWAEAEEVFFNEPLLIAPDIRHSNVEPRFFTLGQTDAGRWLFLVFTVRRQMIRVISARDMSRHERRVYQHAQNQKAP